MTGLETRKNRRFVINKENKEIEPRKNKLEIDPKVKSTLQNAEMVGNLVSSRRRDEVINEFDRENRARNSQRFLNHFNLAQDLYLKGLDDAALEAYLAVLKVSEFDSPKLFEVNKNIGNIFLKRGDYDSAEEYYNKAYTLSPDSEVLLINLGTLEVQRQNFEKALERYRRAVEINVCSDKAWLGLALVHREYGDQELAWANLERAFDINPTNETAMELALQWGVKDSRFKALIAIFEEYFRLAPNDNMAKLNFAKVLICSGRFDAARRQLCKMANCIDVAEETSELIRLLNKSDAE